MPSRSSRARAVLILVIGLCALALPIASVPTVAAAMVRCCCGEHDASDDCGCKDCPAGHRGGDAPVEPSLEACGSGSLDVSLGGAPALPPMAPTPVRVLVTAAAPALAPPPLLILPDPPPSPPPRE